MDRYCKRLIEVDLPIKRISAHARREKSIRHGHISTLHIWWARRPLAACRAVICASLWPDPVDDLCPEKFRQKARELMTKWAQENLKLVSEESYKRFVVISKNINKLDDNLELRKALFDFIADFANWNNSSIQAYLDTSRILTQVSYDSLKLIQGIKPIVVDPFAGGGAIPLESLRIGADSFAADLNPVATLLNKVILEYIPKFGQSLPCELRKWGVWLKNEAYNELSGYYPPEPDGGIPVAYIWARTIKCEGPNCGIEVPVIRSLWLDQTRGSLFALKLVPSNEKIQTKIIQNSECKKIAEGTSKRSSVTCPKCGYTTPRKNVEKQAQKKGLGQQLLAIAIHNKQKRYYRAPTDNDFDVIKKAEKRLKAENFEGLVPELELPYLRSIFNVHIYGIKKWSALFSARQLLLLTTLIKLVRKFNPEFSKIDNEKSVAVKTLLAFIVDKMAMVSCNVARWRGDKGRLEGAFSMMALPMVWDWGELNPFNNTIIRFDTIIEAVAEVIEKNSGLGLESGTIENCSAVSLPLPDDSVAMVFTDPPYYDAIPYANLSDFFYVWLKKMIGKEYPDLFKEDETPKFNEIVQLAERNKIYSHKTKEFFEEQMQLAMCESKRITQSNGIICVVFAHKTTTGWESLINALLNAGLIVTASWPLDTEMGTRFKAIGTASLASSIHIVCRPRENLDVSGQKDAIGDWRDVLAELPKRIHEWMPRLAEEGVVGADAIFSCLGPALEIFSRYSFVEKASGEKVELREYLEQVWAAVAMEALNMIFEGADASGFEEDARLTAMWLWTLRTDVANGGDSEEVEWKTQTITGYALEYDAARKIAQGLGAHLENLKHLVEIKGDTATLLAANSRVSYLFGKDTDEIPKGQKKKQDKQMLLFVDEIKEIEKESGGLSGKLSGNLGRTVLDQLHQSMLLFGAGRGEALKRFLVEDGVGNNSMYWRLAQSLSALYPSGTDEKRWVDGVLARKKSLGF